MANDLSLDAERALILVRRLLREALDDSPTAEEIVRRWREDDTSLAGQLFTRSLLEIMPEIPEDGRQKLMLHMDRVLDRLDTASARERAELEQERAALAGHRAARAAEREQQAHGTVAQLAARVAELERDTEVKRRVRERLETWTMQRPTPAPPAAVQLPVLSPPDPIQVSSTRSCAQTPVATPTANRGPLFSANEATYLTRRAEPALGAGSLGAKSREDAEAAFWLWRGLAGDRPMLDYTREQADDLRLELLRMLASYGKGGRKYEMRANFDPRHWIEVANERQREIDQHNAALPEGHPDRKPGVGVDPLLWTVGG